MPFIDKYGAEYSDDKLTLIKCPEDLSGNFEIRKGTKHIEKSAFENCNNLESITISNEIEFCVFALRNKCSNLHSIFVYSVDNDEELYRIDSFQFQFLSICEQEIIKNEVQCIVSGDSVQNRIEWIKKTAPVLVKIKEQLSGTNAYYLGVSSYVTRKTLNIVEKAYQIEKAKSISNINKSIIIAIVKAFECLDFLDKTNALNEYYNLLKNSVFDTAKKLCVFPFIYGVRVIDMRTSEERFNICKSIKDFEQFIKDFPSSPLAEKAQKIIENQEELEWNNCKSTKDFENYASRYPNGKHINEIKEKIDLAKQQEDDSCWKNSDDFDNPFFVQNIENYLKRHPAGFHVEEAKAKLEQYYYQKFSETASFRRYLKKYPNGCYADEIKKRRKENLVKSAVKLPISILIIIGILALLSSSKWIFSLPLALFALILTVSLLFFSIKPIDINIKYFAKVATTIIVVSVAVALFICPTIIMVERGDWCRKYAPLFFMKEGKEIVSLSAKDYVIVNHGDRTIYYSKVQYGMGKREYNQAVNLSYVKEINTMGMIKAEKKIDYFFKTPPEMIEVNSKERGPHFRYCLDFQYW